MTNLEFLLVFSIVPVGTLVIAAVLFYTTRQAPHQPGE
jgi:hypothetical protein